MSQNCVADIFSMEDKSTPCIDDYDALIIGTPVHHGAPSPIFMRYCEMMPQLVKETPAFIYSTCGLNSFNTNQIISRKLSQKNIVTIMDRDYRGPASDGAIIAPFIKRFFEFEKDIEKKIESDCAVFLDLLKKVEPQGYIPRFRLGSIINAPNKLAGWLVTLKIYLHKNKCARCGKCIEQCPNSAFFFDKNGYPFYSSKNCENCYRCIHHCQNAALSLSKCRTLKKLLRY